jgi:hypothetical protein
MILRALSMDAAIVEDIAQLYQVFDKVPSPQFYQLLIALVPNDFRFYPWIKTKKMQHDKTLLELVANRFQVSKFEANDYVNLLLRSESGQAELTNICRAFGLSEQELETIFEDKKDDGE